MKNAAFVLFLLTYFNAACIGVAVYNASIEKEWAIQFVNTPVFAWWTMAALLMALSFIGAAIASVKRA